MISAPLEMYVNETSSSSFNVATNNESGWPGWHPAAGFLEPSRLLAALLRGKRLLVGVLLVLVFRQLFFLTRGIL